MRPHELFFAGFIRALNAGRRGNIAKHHHSISSCVGFESRKKESCSRTRMQLSSHQLTKRVGLGASAPIAAAKIATAATVP